MLPTSILAGYIFPVVAMPKAMQFVAKLLPFTYFSDTVRNTCLKPLKMHHLFDDMAFLFAFFICEVLVLASIKYAVFHRKSSREGVDAEFSLGIAESGKNAESGVNA